VTQRGAVTRFELVETRAVYQAGDDLAHVVGLARVKGDHSPEFGRVVERLLGRRDVERHRLLPVEVADDAARNGQGMVVVLGQVVADAGDPRMHVAAAEVLGADHFAGCRLHQRRTAEEDGALVLDDDRLVRHGRHVGTARRAGTHDDADLGNAQRRHVGLVVEDAAEVVAVGENIVLGRQVGAAGVDQVDAGQAVLLGDFLGAQVLLHRQRKVGATLHRRVVGDDHAFDALHPADAGDDAGRGHVAAVHAVGRQRRELEEGRAGIDQGVDALARQQLAARLVLGRRFRRTAARDGDGLFAQVGDQRVHRRAVGL
jgi:hypothetical protein